MKKLLVILLVAASLFALVSCSEKGSASFSVGKDGIIHVHFDKKQQNDPIVSKYKGNDIVRYYECKTSYPIVDELGFTAIFRDYISGFALVNEDNSKKDYKLAFTVNGALSNFAAALIDQFGDMININSIIVSYNQSPINVFAMLGLDIDADNWEGLAYAPVYMSTALWGLGLDAYAGNIKSTKVLQNTLLRTISIVSASSEAVCGQKTFKSISVPEAAYVTFEEAYDDTSVLVDAVTVKCGAGDEFKKDVEYVVGYDVYFFKFTPDRDYPYENKNKTKVYPVVEVGKTYATQLLGTSVDHADLVWGHKAGYLDGFSTQYGSL